MAKTILVPIDFHVDSLHTLKLALESNSDQRIHIVLMYAEYLGDSITDLLFYSAQKSIVSHTTPAFTEALEIIKNRFEGAISTISIQVFNGVNINALTIFCEVHNVDAIYISKSYKLKTPKQAFDPTSLLKKSKLSIIEVE